MGKQMFQEMAYNIYFCLFTPHKNRDWVFSGVLS